MLETTDATHPASLAASGPGRYNPSVNPSVSAKDTNATGLNVISFGRLKEAIGHGQESREIAADSRIEDVFARCLARYPELAEHRRAIAVSRNRELPW
jgi:hypothetical protein